MAFEGIICPVCSGSLNEEDFKGKIICPHCSTNQWQSSYQICGLKTCPKAWFLDRHVSDVIMEKDNNAANLFFISSNGINMYIWDKTIDWIPCMYKMYYAVLIFQTNK